MSDWQSWTYNIEQALSDFAKKVAPEGLFEKLKKAPTAEMKIGKPEVLRFGALREPTLDLKHRPHVRVPGTDDFATVRSMGVGYDDGEYLIPTVSHEGTLMEPAEAIKYYKKTGEHMGVYPDIETSNRAGEKLHLEQAAMGRPAPPPDTDADADPYEDEER